MLQLLLYRERMVIGNPQRIRVVEMVFSGLLGARVMYPSNKSRRNVDLATDALIADLDGIGK